MKYAAINQRFTEIVAAYLAKGYVFNTATARGSQGEITKVDLTNGSEIIRVLLDSFSVWDDRGLDGLKLIVGRAEDHIKPHSENSWDTIWNQKLEVISEERFYQIGRNRNNVTFYGTREEAVAAKDLSFARYRARISRNENKLPKNAQEIAKRIVREKLGVKRIVEADVKISRSDNGYIVTYRNKAYRLR